jgi:hypothetical protein
MGRRRARREPFADASEKRYIGNAPQVLWSSADRSPPNWWPIRGSKRSKETATVALAVLAVREKERRVADVALCDGAENQQERPKYRACDRRIAIGSDPSSSISTSS